MHVFLRRFTRHHTAAVAYLALFFALGGTAYAAQYVTSQEILNETIQAEDIAAGAVATGELAQDAVTIDRIHYDAVNGAKVINGSLGGVDVANESLTGYDIEDESLKGQDLALTTVSSESGSESAMAKTVTAYCPSGRRALGGGGEILHKEGDHSSGPDNRVAIAQSSPGTGSWTVRAEVIRHPATRKELGLELDDNDEIVFTKWIFEDHLTYYGPWVLKVWALCA